MSISEVSEVLSSPGAGVAPDRSEEPDGSASGGPQDESSERGRTSRRRAILHARLSDTDWLSTTRVHLKSTSDHDRFNPVEWEPNQGETK